MSGNVNRFNGARIVIDGTEREFHTYDDWDLYITNTDIIGEPEQNIILIDVPGSNKIVDVSEVLTNRITYKSRKIKINLAGTREKTSWDNVMSSIRNSIDGKRCRIFFDNDPYHFWLGRVSVNGFESVLRLGRFSITMDADPYKYDFNLSTDPWLWDPFSFIDGVIKQEGGYNVEGSKTVEIPSGQMLVSPEFVVSNMTSSTFTVTVSGKTYSLSVGRNRIPEVLVNGDNAVEMTFTGTATVQIVYRGGSL